jgi:hypothetical protein
MNISEDVIEKLKSQVKFESDADIQQFIADALNSYIELGQMVNGGGKLRLHMPNGDTRGIILPFQKQSA